MSRDLTDALSKLFIKLGGKLSDSKENKGPVDYIDDITNIVEPGGGGSEPLVIEGSVSTWPTTDSGSSENIEIDDLNVSDLHDAVINHKSIIFRLIDKTFDDQPWEIALNNINEWFEDGYYLLTAINFVIVQGSTLTKVQLTYDKNNLTDYSATVQVFSIGRQTS